MSSFSRILTKFLANSNNPSANSNFHSMVCAVQKTQESFTPGGLFTIITRTVIRNYFPRANERKRIVKHGFKTRMSTANGRRVLMNRILKGRFVYSH
ncbi:hypothetical protein ABEB36_007741 [Hypothenemus hampei]|uniref:39S ribosomal protein L34, mitochondrial n=1 Tax=Hypothenemus hampei TaxID=57062 RepID=A0ABD1EUZ3_HYPHA